MTETAREALLNRKKTGDSAPQQSARDLLSARASGKTFDVPKDPAKPDPPGGYSSPYAYFTPEVQRSLGNTGEDVGAVTEPLMQMGSSMASNAAGGIAGIGTGLFNMSPAGMLAEKLGFHKDAADVTNAITEAGTYQPQSEGGQNVSAALSSGYNPLTWPGRAGEALGDKSDELGLPPLISAGLRTAPDALLAATGLKGMKAADTKFNTPKASVSTQELLNKNASSQSMGAAGAAVDINTISPELRGAVEQAVRKTGGAVNPEALARQVQADSLPVKVRLSEGQALGDERLISIEQNARGKHDAYSKGFQEQNKALVDNLRAFRDEAGPDVFSTNSVEHGDTLISRYKAIDAERNADISAKYQALRDAAGGDFPIDTPGLLNNVRAALKKEHSTNAANPDIMSSLEESATTGKIALEDFEQLRSSLARIQREGDGSARHAAGVIRKQLEEMPLQPGAEQLKGLADTARAAARERFQALDADPAYKAAVEESTPPDKFVHKFVINGTRDDMARLSEAMGPDEAAKQTIKVATLDHLRKSAGLDSDFNGNFTQAGYNKAVRKFEEQSKLGLVLDTKTAEQVRTLGDVARYTQFQPKGSFVNNSNTFVAAAGEKAADALEGVLNYKTGGIPIASHVRKQFSENKVRKQAEHTFAPGAGLVKLNELMKGKEQK